MLALEIILATILFLAWVLCLFLLVFDPLPFWQKVVWFLALTILAPIAIAHGQLFEPRGKKDDPRRN